MTSKKNPFRRQPQQQRSQERVEKILDAAAIVFDEIGFEAATTHAIALRANTAVGTLYQFFPDKLAIFNALELRHIERVYVIWDQLLRPEIIQLPFADFIQIITSQFQRLFEQPTSRIVFAQFFTSPTIFKNIDASFTQEAIQFMAKLFKARNPGLTDQRSKLLAEVCVHSVNTLILLAIRSSKSHQQEIFQEIEALMKAYLKAEFDDDIINHNSIKPLEQLAKTYRLNSRQTLILKSAANYSEITIQSCEAMFPNVSRRTLQRDLKAMVEQKLLIYIGNTDLRRYRLNYELANL
ncbi:transcriptional regulator, TetR family [Stanieria cyanosphaera PCC 7437]|uniref:Transcriptional regulator, TetR family n=1 Tax=Stanieria cyanosphaera (strain ATCC 29371 / PCC 7437) TaxID=111780 RepID=K9XY63_STAC7|nr:TetR/AcrR family transcriptional regulator [Stanieria cyanosphaera]AFZ37046.1 transcriptional regulator, TetR family [Stanieria cyanosphaera PCC 7437]